MTKKIIAGLAIIFIGMGIGQKLSLSANAKNSTPTKVDAVEAKQADATPVCKPGDKTCESGQQAGNLNPPKPLAGNLNPPKPLSDEEAK